MEGNDETRPCGSLAGVLLFLCVAWALLLASPIAGAQTRAPKAQSKTSPAPLPALAREFLAAHNEARAKVKVKPLQWSDRLAVISQKWANTLLSRRKFIHSDSPYGENLFEISGATANPTMVVRSWAAEARFYDYQSNSCRGLCGHYTQLVWRDSRQVGCAVARGAGREVWVCSYDPPGNTVGERPY